LAGQCAVRQHRDAAGAIQSAPLCSLSIGPSGEACTPAVQILVYAWILPVDPPEWATSSPLASTPVTRVPSCISTPRRSRVADRAALWRLGERRQHGVDGVEQNDPSNQPRAARRPKPAGALNRPGQTVGLNEAR
jgi:hypothetical protein